jgi:FtsP/CotA-like multicopper oxidase with cupredoxin domain
VRILLATVSATLAAGALGGHGDSNARPLRPVERIVINDNRARGGVLAKRVLTMHLRVHAGTWHPDRDTDKGIDVNAFGEDGKPLQIPGPLFRVRQGTEIHTFVRNDLPDSTLIVHGLIPHGAALPSSDTIQVRPGATREVRFVADAAGTYYYWASTNAGPFGKRRSEDRLLSGAFIVDPPGTADLGSDRVFLISIWSEKVDGQDDQEPDGQFRYAINGKSWPNTERLSYALGDTIRFRVLNVTSLVHPMHLHGFYFDVNSHGDGMRDTVFDPNGTPHRAVTERLAQGRTFTMTWIPDRSGNWLFHCHENLHVLRNSNLDGAPRPKEQDVMPMNHALEMMGGLVMGIAVREPRGRPAPRAAAPTRWLRLIARVDSGGTPDEPAYGYELEERFITPPARAPLRPGPTVVLKRGEPVSIMVVNELPEMTSVHWHGIELDSYYDGVSDFAGHPGHIPSAIAPRDSFEARFTPPRSGTFLYHPHADELRQQKAGMSGAIVVVDSVAGFDPVHDIVLLLTPPRSAAEVQTIYLNGMSAPAARQLRAGEHYRLRFADMQTGRPSLVARIVSDSGIVTWRAIAKDGMDLPADQATTRIARQQMGNGETYDFEFIPRPGDLRLTVSSAAGVVLASMPLRVH